MTFSFISTIPKGFIRNHDGSILEITAATINEANSWFIESAERLGYIGVTVYCWCWEE